VPPAREVFRGLTPTATEFRRCAAGAYNGGMARTFSLGRLMVVVTLVCVICAVAASYGEDFGAYLLVASLFVPTAIVCLTLVSFAKRRKTTLAISILGAVIGWFLLMPVSMHMGPGPKTAWEVIQPDIIPFAIFPPIGALVFGGSLLLDEKFSYCDEGLK